VSGRAPAAQETPLALICGGGSLPLAVADSVTARGRRVLLFPLRGAADAADYTAREAHWLYLGQFGKFARIARAAGCHEMVFIGSLVRPSLRQIRPDIHTLLALPDIMRAFRGGDDHLLSNIGKLVEARGFRLCGAHEVAPDILMPFGPLTRVHPGPGERGDIAFGFDYLRAAGPFDVGQAVVVSGKHVLAVEAVEGTDLMLARIAELRQNGRLQAPPGSGVLVKAPKPGQDRRFDLPTIGPQTVARVVEAGLTGIAVTAGSAVIAEPECLIESADRAGIFVVGVSG